MAGQNLNQTLNLMMSQMIDFKEIPNGIAVAGCKIATKE